MAQRRMIYLSSPVGQKLTTAGGLLESGMKMIFRLFLETLTPTDKKIDLLPQMSHTLGFPAEGDLKDFLYI